MQTEPRPRSSLDSPTKLDRAAVPNEVESRWLLNLYPDAAEAGGCLVSGAAVVTAGSRMSATRIARLSRRSAAPEGRPPVLRCEPAQPSRDAHVCGRGLPRPAPVPGRRGGVLPAAHRIVGKPFPYLWVPEWHPGGHGLHAHFAVGQFVHWRTIKAAWGRGHRRHPDAQQSAGRIWRAGRGAAGGAVPVEVRRQGPRRRGPAGLHRYEVAQGFAPGGPSARGADAR